MENWRYTDKKETNFLILIGCKIMYEELRKGFLIYDEMRKYLTIYEEAVSHIWICTRSHVNSLICEDNFILLFISDC